MSFTDSGGGGAMPISVHDHLQDRVNQCRLIILGKAPLDKRDCEEKLAYYGSSRIVELTPDRRAAFVEFECPHVPLLVARLYQYWKAGAGANIRLSTEESYGLPMPEGLDRLLPGCSLNNFVYLRNVPRSLPNSVLSDHFSREFGGLEVKVIRTGIGKSSICSLVVIAVKGGKAESFHNNTMKFCEIRHDGKSATFYAIPTLPELADSSRVFLNGGCDSCNVSLFAGHVNFMEHEMMRIRAEAAFVASHRTALHVQEDRALAFPDISDEEEQRKWGIAARTESPPLPPSFPPSGLTPAPSFGEVTATRQAERRAAPTFTPILARTPFTSMGQQWPDVPPPLPDIPWKSREEEEQIDHRNQAAASATTSDESIGRARATETKGMREYDGWMVDDRCLSDERIGSAATVKWIGVLAGHTRVYAGLEFDEPIGKGTGMYRGEELFKSRTNHAGFVPVSSLFRIEVFPERQSAIGRPPLASLPPRPMAITYVDNDGFVCSTIAQMSEQSVYERPERGHGDDKDSIGLAPMRVEDLPLACPICCEEFEVEGDRRPKVFTCCKQFICQTCEERVRVAGVARKADDRDYEVECPFCRRVPMVTRHVEVERRETRDAPRITHSLAARETREDDSIGLSPMRVEDLPLECPFCCEEFEVEGDRRPKVFTCCKQVICQTCEERVRAEGVARKADDRDYVMNCPFCRSTPMVTRPVEMERRETRDAPRITHSLAARETREGVPSMSSALNTQPLPSMFDSPPLPSPAPLARPIDGMPSMSSPLNTQQLPSMFDPPLPTPPPAPSAPLARPVDADGYAPQLHFNKGRVARNPIARVERPRSVSPSSVLQKEAAMPVHETREESTHHSSSLAGGYAPQLQFTKERVAREKRPDHRFAGMEFSRPAPRASQSSALEARATACEARENETHESSSLDSLLALIDCPTIEGPIDEQPAVKDDISQPRREKVVHFDKSADYARNSRERRKEERRKEREAKNRGVENSGEGSTGEAVSMGGTDETEPRAAACEAQEDADEPREPTCAVKTVRRILRRREGSAVEAVAVPGTEEEIGRVLVMLNYFVAAFLLSKVFVSSHTERQTTGEDANEPLDEEKEMQGDHDTLEDQIESTVQQRDVVVEESERSVDEREDDVIVEESPSVVEQTEDDVIDEESEEAIGESLEILVNKSGEAKQANDVTVEESEPPMIGKEDVVVEEEIGTLEDQSAEAKQASDVIVEESEPPMIGEEDVVVEEEVGILVDQSGEMEQESLPVLTNTCTSDELSGDVIVEESEVVVEGREELVVEETTESEGEREEKKRRERTVRRIPDANSHRSSMESIYLESDHASSMFSGSIGALDSDDLYSGEEDNWRSDGLYFPLLSRKPTEDSQGLKQDRVYDAAAGDAPSYVMTMDEGVKDVVRDLIDRTEEAIDLTPSPTVSLVHEVSSPEVPDERTVDYDTTSEESTVSDDNSKRTAENGRLVSFIAKPVECEEEDQMMFEQNRLSTIDEDSQEGDTVSSDVVSDDVFLSEGEEKSIDKVVDHTEERDGSPFLRNRFSVFHAALSNDNLDSSSEEGEKVEMKMEPRDVVSLSTNQCETSSDTNIDNDEEEERKEETVEEEERKEVEEDRKEYTVDEEAVGTGEKKIATEVPPRTFFALNGRTPFWPRRNAQVEERVEEEQGDARYPVASWVCAHGGTESDDEDDWGKMLDAIERGRKEEQEEQMDSSASSVWTVHLSSGSSEEGREKEEEEDEKRNEEDEEERRVEEEEEEEKESVGDQTESHFPPTPMASTDEREDEEEEMEVEQRGSSVSSEWTVHLSSDSNEEESEDEREEGEERTMEDEKEDKKEECGEGEESIVRMDEKEEEMEMEGDGVALSSATSNVNLGKEEGEDLQRKIDEWRRYSSPSLFRTAGVVDSDDDSEWESEQSDSRLHSAPISSAEFVRSEERVDLSRSISDREDGEGADEREGSRAVVAAFDPLAFLARSVTSKKTRVDSNDNEVETETRGEKDKSEGEQRLEASLGKSFSHLSSSAHADDGEAVERDDVTSSTPPRRWSRASVVEEDGYLNWLTRESPTPRGGRSLDGEWDSEAEIVPLPSSVSPNGTWGTGIVLAQETTVAATVHQDDKARLSVDSSRVSDSPPAVRGSVLGSHLSAVMPTFSRVKPAVAQKKD